MGSVRPLYIKRAAREFIEKYPEKFSADFRQNSRALDEIMKMESKTTRNRVAGYICKILKNRLEA